MSITPPLDITHTPPAIAPCEHIAGNEKFARKALQLQEQHLRPDGTSKVDITLDLEDGAPIGGEDALRKTFIDLITSPLNRRQQIGARVHATTSPHFEKDIAGLVTAAPTTLAYITIPKVTSLREILWVDGLVTHYLEKKGITRRIPLHLLIETPEALAQLDALASHPSVETLDFGLMDFISHLGGAIPSSGMTSPGQFEHPILQQVKTDIALAALRHNKIPNHNVTVDVRNPMQAYQDAYKARHHFGFLRMWSIHPEQVPHIINGMAPTADEVAEATTILTKAQAAHWGPIEYGGRLHDRASYRYYWGVLNRG